MFKLSKANPIKEWTFLIVLGSEKICTIMMLLSVDYTSSFDILYSKYSISVYKKAYVSSQLEFIVN